jgi:hypothetical protein
MKITKEYVAEAMELAAQADSKQETITDRITEILFFLGKHFGGTLKTWYFGGAGEGEIGNLWDHFSDEEIDCIETDWGSGRRAVSHNWVNTFNDGFIIDKNGNQWRMEGSIPTRWLFEDFEQEIIDGKLKFEQEQEVKKLNLLKEKAKLNSLANAAKKKLTKAELAALKKSL